MNSFSRKYRKLKNNPKLFFKDMWNKQIRKIKQHSPVKYTGKFQYTIVSAVYNVEKYLNDYFKSIVNQSLDFKKHIHIICVDDGSTDHSAQIIKQWQKKYPNNISYYYKENGGQASARNLGLDYVKTEWVTFIDPDDFIHVDYFKIIDDEIGKDENIVLIATELATYHESNESYSYKNGHLSYNYASNTLVPVNNLNNHIHLSVCASMFNNNLIKKYNLFFDEKIKPCFEDGNFISDYLLYSRTNNIKFLPDCYYFYRSRADMSSTTNQQWDQEGKYIDVFKYGYIPMFKKYKKHWGYVPTNIQFTFLFYAIQYFKKFLDQKEKLKNVIDDKKIKIFNKHMNQCFEYIDETTIMKFHLLGCDFFTKKDF